MNKLALNGGKKYKSKPFPKWPMYDAQELTLVEEVVKSNHWWRVGGSKVEEFEKKFATYHEVKHCLAISNGTHAIELVLAALEIGKGDEVIVPAFTFISTMTAVIYCNATPIPVDIDPNTLCMDVEAFEKAITPRTKAVIPVHMAGHCCDMDKIKRIAKAHGIKVIEDAAHAHGAEWQGKKVGAYCDAATFSFQNGKIMTSGEGGAITTNDPELYEKLYLIHGVGRPKGDRVYKHLYLGSNYRMTEFQGAVLIAQLERLEKQNYLRRKNAILLNSYLKQVGGVIPQEYKDEATINSHYMYMFYYEQESFGHMSREWFIDALIAEGIPAFAAYPVVTNVEFYKNEDFRSHANHAVQYSEDAFPISEKVANDVVWLPHFTLLGDEKDIEEIAGAITKIKELSRLTSF